MPNASYVYGLDLSKNQGIEIDSLSLAANNLAFVICKATDGITYTDPDFGNNWKVAAEKGFVRGAYHFYRCDDDPAKQANNFLNAVGTLAPGDLPPTIDVEEAGLTNCAGVNIQESVLAWLTAVETATGRKPLIYTDPNTAITHLNNPAFAAYPLYIADYNTSGPDLSKTVWAKNGWVFWQQSGSYKIGNMENDYDAFDGNSEALQSFITGR